MFRLKTTCLRSLIVLMILRGVLWILYIDYRISNSPCYDDSIKRRKMYLCEKTLKRIVIIFFILAAFIALDLFASRKMISVSRYECQSEKLESSITIVQLSDLHNSEFGPDNSRLIARVKAQSPDVILMTGDMLNGDEDRTDIVIDLVVQASQIAPVYYSLGNHEVEYMEERPDNVPLTDQLERAGAVVLDKEYVDTVINGQPVRIGGVYCL